MKVQQIIGLGDDRIFEGVQRGEAKRRARKNCSHAAYARGEDGYYGSIFGPFGKEVSIFLFISKLM